MAHGRTWAIRAARVYDGETLHKGFPLVVIDGARIAAVDSTTASASADLQVLDLGDVTLLPGLIDAHVHLAFDPDTTSKHQEIADEEMVDLVLVSGQAYHLIRASYDCQCCSCP